MAKYCVCVSVCVCVCVCGWVGGYICTYVYIHGTLAEFIILRRLFCIVLYLSILVHPFTSDIHYCQ